MYARGVSAPNDVNSVTHNNLYHWYYQQTPSEKFNETCNLYLNNIWMTLSTSKFTFTYLFSVFISFYIQTLNNNEVSKLGSMLNEDNIFSYLWLCSVKFTETAHQDWPVKNKVFQNVLTAKVISKVVFVMKYTRWEGTPTIFMTFYYFPGYTNIAAGLADMGT